MIENLYKERKYIRSKVRIDKIKKFYTKVITYFLIILILAGLNYYTNNWETPWFIWVGLGLSVRLIFKVVKTFERSSFK